MKKMKKTVSVILMLILAAGLFAGCGHQHTWVEATCTESRTCSECGETEGKPLGHEWTEATCTEARFCTRCGTTRGESLGHDWKEATCTEPEICSRCGETQGEPLGHTPLDADYWTASLCAVCGEELGPVLTPDFEAHGLSCGMELGETYDYVTVCYMDSSKTTVGKAAITNYEVVPAIENYEAAPGMIWNFEEREGYEWRVVTAQILFDDDNAWNYGMSVGTCNEDYYDIEYHDDTTVYDDADHDYGSDATFQLNYKGETYECRKLYYGAYTGWSNHSNTFVVTGAYQVPVGYDGRVFGLYNYGTAWEEGLYIYDIADADSIFFRMA